VLLFFTARVPNPQTRTKKQMRRQLASGARGRRALAHVRPPRRRAAGSR
jgi:hypothetical protein